MGERSIVMMGERSIVTFGRVALAVAMAVVATVLLSLPAGAAAAKTKKKPDLVVASLGQLPPSVAAGSTLAVSDKVRNRGKRSRPSENGYFLSPDQFRDLADIQLDGSRGLPKLRTRRSSTGSASLVVPAVIRSGDYRLLVCADVTEQIRERSEANNCKASDNAISVAGQGPPDLTPPRVPRIIDTDPDPPANNNSPEVQGRGAEAGSIVRIYTTPTCTGTPIGIGDANVFNGPKGITVAIADDQTARLRATATDAPGNASGCSAPFAYEHDPSKPREPTITHTNPPSPANEDSPAVRGNGAEPGSTVKIFANDSTCAPGAQIGSGSAAVFNGSTGISVTVDEDQTTSLWATATDPAGNFSACSGVAFNYTEDSTPPATPVIARTNPESPDTSRTPAVYGGAESSSTVRIFAGCGGPQIGGGTPSNASNFTSDVGIIATVPPNQTTQLVVTATDAAGNTSDCSAAVPYRHDSLAPAAPTINDTDPDSPANNNNPVVQGSGAEAGSIVRIYADDATCAPGALIGGGGPGSGAAFNGAGITVTVADNHSTQLRATATDLAGNVSGCSAARAYIEDSTSATPTITATNPPSPANDDSPEVTGTGAEAGSTVRIYATSGCSGAAIGTGLESAFIGAGITVTVADDQPTQLRANATDAVGNVSACSAPFAYTEDSTAPETPTITDTDPDPPANDNAPQVSGSAEAGSTVWIFATSDCSGAAINTVSTSASAFIGAGITVTVADNQTTELRATATDAAGNVSGCSAPFPFTHDSSL